MTSIKSINTYLIVSVLLKFSCPKILQPLAEMILNPDRRKMPVQNLTL